MLRPEALMTMRFTAGGATIGALLWLFICAADPQAGMVDESAKRAPISLAETPSLASNIAALSAAPFSQALMGPATARADASGGLKLVGIDTSPTRAAALVSIGGAPAHWLKLGETFGGYVLEQVQPDRATFRSSANAELEARLFGEGGTANSAPIVLGQSLSDDPGKRNATETGGEIRDRSFSRDSR